MENSENNELTIRSSEVLENNNNNEDDTHILYCIIRMIITLIFI